MFEWVAELKIVSLVIGGERGFIESCIEVKVL